jgi:uncharacterized protein (DUF1330 family)
MKTQVTLLLTLVTGIGIGAAAVQGLHAQVKPKAYVIGEYVTVDKAEQAALTAKVNPMIVAAGGRTLNTAGGKIIQRVGEPPKEGITIIEWDNVDKALAFLDGPYAKIPQADRDKGRKYSRAFIVEATQ